MSEYISSIHIRRTDKINDEAVFHPVEEYMHHAEQWFKEHQINESERLIYLMSDDHSVLTEAAKK